MIIRQANGRIQAFVNYRGITLKKGQIYRCFGISLIEFNESQILTEINVSQSSSLENSGKISTSKK